MCWDEQEQRRVGWGQSSGNDDGDGVVCLILVCVDNGQFTSNYLMNIII